MDALDPVLLSRIQFAFTIAFHIVFPAFTIGLSSLIAVLIGRWMWSGEERYRRLARFWTRIFAVSFAMGVVSGIALSYQFGTNWSRFSVVVGNVVGPVLAYETLTAFFLEASFLGVMLFGWDRFPRWLHFTAAIIVAVGTVISAFWIISANSWMQFPTGHAIENGVAVPVDWWAIVFNPTFPLRLAHMLTACYLATALVVMSVGARYALQERFPDHARTLVTMGLGMMILLAPAQAVIGDFHGIDTMKYQPTKLASMEGHWKYQGPAPLVLFGLPNAITERNDYEVAIPKLGSLILTHTLDGRVPALTDVPKADRPNVAIVFWSFRIMVGIGVTLIGLAAWGGLLWARGRLFESRWWLRTASLSWPLGFIAILAGWVTTESGRQPWIATGILRTVDAASPVSGAAVATSLAFFVVVYFVVFGIGILYINRLMAKGPDEAAATDPRAPEGQGNRPLSGAQRAAKAAIPDRLKGPAPGPLPVPQGAGL